MRRIGIPLCIDSVVSTQFIHVFGPLKQETVELMQRATYDFGLSIRITASE